MTRPLVSIVIATYRSRIDHLSSALSSALKQTHANLEVIVSDDSPDDSLRHVAMGFRDPRLHYRHNAPALGVAQNHWSAFACARGDFVAVLNHDDWLAPTFVSDLVDPLQKHPEAALAFCDHWIIDGAGRRLDDQSDSNSAACGRANLPEGLQADVVSLVAEQTIPMAMGAVFRRSALPAALPRDAGPAYDLWLTYLLCRGGGAVWYVPQRLSAWRMHGDSLSSEAGIPWLQGAASCWSEVARDERFASARAAARAKAAAGFYACATRAWATGQRRDCLRFAMRSVGALVTLKGALACVLPLLPARLAPAQWVPGRSAA